MIVTLPITHIFRIPDECSTCFQGIACRHNSIYLTAPKTHEIYRLSDSFALKERVTVQKAYTKICYDTFFECFWAVTDSDLNIIYKLDCSLREIGRIDILLKNHAPAPFTGISCTGAANKLLVSWKSELAVIEKIDAATPYYIELRDTHFECCAVQGFANCFLALHREQKRTAVAVYSGENELLSLCYLPREYDAVDFAPVSQASLCSESSPQAVYILAVQYQREVCLMKAVLCLCSDYGVAPLNLDACLQEVVFDNGSSTQASSSDTAPQKQNVKQKWVRA